MWVVHSSAHDVDMKTGLNYWYQTATQVQGPCQYSTGMLYEKS